MRLSCVTQSSGFLGPFAHFWDPQLPTLMTIDFFLPHLLLRHRVDQAIVSRQGFVFRCRTSYDCGSIFGCVMHFSARLHCAALQNSGSDRNTYEARGGLGGWFQNWKAKFPQLFLPCTESVSGSSIELVKWPCSVSVVRTTCNMWLIITSFSKRQRGR